jgi:hypothetical protein
LSVSQNTPAELSPGFLEQPQIERLRAFESIAALSRVSALHLRYG